MHPARHHGPFYPRMDGPGSPLGRGVLPWPRTWPWRADWIREGSLASHDMAVYLSNNGNASAIRNARTITECDEQSASHWLRLRAYRCRIFAVPSRAVCAWPRIQIIQFCAPALPLVKSSMPPLVLSPVCRADRRGCRRVLGRDGSRRRPKRLGSRCLPVRRGLGPAGAGRRAQRGRAGGCRGPVLRFSVACGFECPHPAFLCRVLACLVVGVDGHVLGNPLRGASRRIR